MIKANMSKQSTKIPYSHEITPYKTKNHIKGEKCLSNKKTKNQSTSKKQNAHLSGQAKGTED